MAARRRWWSETQLQSWREGGLRLNCSGWWGTQAATRGFREHHPPNLLVAQYQSPGFYFYFYCKKLVTQCEWLSACSGVPRPTTNP